MRRQGGVSSLAGRRADIGKRDNGGGSMRSGSGHRHEGTFFSQGRLRSALLPVEPCHDCVCGSL